MIIKQIDLKKIIIITNMNRVKLEILHGFGSNCQQGLYDSVSLISFADEQQRLLYPIGKYFALKTMDSTETSFIPLPQSANELICFAVSPDKSHLALSHYTQFEPAPIITIYSIQNAFANKEKPKHFRYTDNAQDKIQCMAFSNNARFLACMTSEFKILFIDMSRFKVVGSSYIKHTVTRIQINPEETHLISLSGPNCFKILRVQEKTVKEMGEIKQLQLNQNFTDHKWATKDKLLLCNDQGKLFIIVNYELVQMISHGFNSPGVGIKCIETFSRGFLLGSKDGCFALWIKDEENEMTDQHHAYLLQRQFNSLTESQIVSMSISKNENLVAVAYNNNDICTFDLDSLLPHIQSQETTNAQKEVEFQFIYNGFHSGPITSMDICTQRPIILTACQSDSSIRIWNYQAMRCDLAKKFSLPQSFTPLLTIAIHPNGYYLSASFIDKIRLFYLMDTSLRIYQEIPLANQNVLCFSKGGHLLAASGSQEIVIFQSYTLEKLYTLKGNAPIKSLKFHGADTSLISQDEEGQIIEFFYIQGKREFKFDTEKGIIASVNKKLYVGKENAMLKDKEKMPIDRQLECLIGVQMNLNDWRVIGGTKDGQVVVYGENLGNAQDVLSAHKGVVSHLCVSPDGKYIVSAGSDGCVFVLQLKMIDEGKQPPATTEEDETMQNREFIVDEHLGDVLLMDRKKIEGFYHDVKVMKNDIRNFEEKLRVSQESCQKQIEQINNDAKAYVDKEVLSWSKQYNDANLEKNRLENEMKNILRKVENKQLRAVDELENLYENKIRVEQERSAKFEADILEQQIEYREKIEELNKKNMQSLFMLRDSFLVQMKSVNRVFQKTVNDAKKIRKNLEGKLVCQENELEQEMNENHEHNEDQIQQQRQKFDTLKYKNENLKQENLSFKLSRETAEYNFQMLQEEYKKTQDLFQASNRKIDQLTLDLQEREMTLRLKDKKLTDFKTKVIELEKNRHIMAFKTSEMRSSLEPKEHQIEQLKIELFKLEGEFEQMLKQSTIQNQKLIKQNVQIGVLEKNIQIQVDQTQQQDAYYNKIIMDIYDTVKNRDKKEWPNQMTKFYKVYVQKLDIKQQEKDPDSNEEQKRQVNHLEHSIEALYDTSIKKLRRREEDIHNKTRENAILLSDLNELRIQNRALHSNLDLLKQNQEDNKVLIQKQRENIKQEKTLIGNQNFQSGMSFTNDSLEKTMKTKYRDSRQVVSLEQVKPTELQAEIEKNKEKIYQLERNLKKLQKSVQIHEERNSCKVSI